MGNIRGLTRVVATKADAPMNSEAINLSAVCINLLNSDLIIIGLSYYLKYFLNTVFELMFTTSPIG